MPKNKEEDRMEFKKKKLKFPAKIKSDIERYLTRKNLEITYFEGYMMELDKANISNISPHKILFKKEDKELVILYYGDHHYDDKLFYINESKNPCTFGKLRELISKYF